MSGKVDSSFVGVFDFPHDIIPIKLGVTFETLGVLDVEIFVFEL
jgi:hypothetical protein